MGLQAMLTAVEYRELVKAHREQAKTAGTIRNTRVLNNVAHTLTVLATQLEMLDECNRGDRLRPRIVGGAEARRSA